MSQRNPLNERNQNDTKAGKTRKSAASAKPVMKRVFSLYEDPNNKPKKDFLSLLMGAETAEEGRGSQGTSKGC